MPNEVFLRTREGLSTMVSSRAADRILEGALKGSGHNPDEVDRLQMRSALMGPVLQELERVLPRDGLKRNLERLARTLREKSAGDRPNDPASDSETPRALLTGSIPSQVVPVDGSGEQLNGSAEGVGGEAPSFGLGEFEEISDVAAVQPVRAASEEASEHSAAAGGAGGKGAAAEPVKVTPRLVRRLDDEELEEKVTRFALIEQVRLVAAVRADGDVPLVRGEGLDLELLSRVSRLTLSLLAKGGTLRSLHLGHSLGQLFLFPIGPDLLVVYGGADLNLGTVTTAFTALALEEDL